MPKPRWIGEYFWTHGPHVLGTPAACKAIAASLSEADRKKLVAAEKKAKPIAKVTIAGHDLYVLAGSHHTRFIPIDAKSVVVFRLTSHANEFSGELDKAMAYDPGWTTEPWATTKLALDVPKAGLVLFDSIAQHPEAPQNAKRGKASLALPLPSTAGYVVEHIAKQAFGPKKRHSAELYYLHPKGHRPALVGSTAEPEAPPALVVAKDVAKAAKALKFVETEGGPFVFMPARVAKQWWGVCNEAGDPVYGEEPTHYDRACDAKGSVPLLKVGDAKALVLRSPDPAALHALENGVLIVRWIGADHAAAVLAPAVGPGKFKATRQKVESRGEPWLLFDATRDGRDVPAKLVAKVGVPKGTYAIEEMDEWSGTISLAGKTSDAMTSAIRLVRRS
jgi:hypothetical protein